MIKAVKDQSGDHLNTGDTQMSLSSTYNWELRPSKNFYAAIRLSKKKRNFPPQNLFYLVLYIDLFNELNWKLK